MHLLIITYWFDPEPVPRAIRWKALIDYFVQEGHTVTTIVPPKRNVERPHPETYSIRQTKQNIFMRLSSAVIDKRSPPPHETQMPVGKFSTLRFLKKILTELLYQCTWPDSSIFWLFPAYQSMRSELQHRHYDCLISIGLPITPHIAAALTKKSNPSLKWIAEYGDPFYVNPGALRNHRKWLSRFDRLLESKVLQQVNAISVPVESAAQIYRTLLPEKSSSIIVIPQFYAPPDNSMIEYFASEIQLPNDCIHFVFAGTFYKTIRNPSILLEALSIINSSKRVPPIHLHIIGHISEVEESLKTYQTKHKTLFIHGIRPREYCLAFFSKAHATCNILNDTPLQVPSKINDCIMYSRYLLTFDPRYPKPMESNSFTATIPYNEPTNVAHCIQHLIPFLITNSFSDTNRPEVITVRDAGNQFQHLMTENIHHP